MLVVEEIAWSLSLAAMKYDGGSNNIISTGDGKHGNDGLTSWKIAGANLSQNAAGGNNNADDGRETLPQWLYTDLGALFLK